MASQDSSLSCITLEKFQTNNESKPLNAHQVTISLNMKLTKALLTKRFYEKYFLWLRRDLMFFTIATDMYVYREGLNRLRSVILKSKSSKYTEFKSSNQIT